MISTTRVVLAGTGSAGSERREVEVVAALRDEGIEVVYAGMRQSAEAMAGAALQEDADVLGVYLSSPEHAVLVEAVLALLAREGAGDVAVMVAGDLTTVLVERLQAAGVARVFAGEVGADKVVEYVKTVTHTREETQ